jgi:hypothetical protein
MSEFDITKEINQPNGVETPTTVVKSDLESLPFAFSSGTDWIDRQRPSDFDSPEGPTM